MGDGRPAFSAGAELPCPCNFSEEKEEEALQIVAGKTRLMDPFRPIGCTSFNDPPAYRGYEVYFYTLQGVTSNPSDPAINDAAFKYTLTDKDFAYQNLVKFRPAGEIGIGANKRPVLYKSHPMVHMVEPEDYDEMEEDDKKQCKRIGPYYIRPHTPAKRTMYPVIVFGTHCQLCLPGAKRRQ